jgi:nicotinate phosphoribosyltransferase
LKTTCPFFKPSYLNYLSTFRFNPSQVQIQFIPTTAESEYGSLDIIASGTWSETILWEVPLMACLSEIYYEVVMTDWSCEGQAGEQLKSFFIFFSHFSFHSTEAARRKAQVLLDAGCVFSEFGTRRRRSFHVQDLVMQAIIRASQEISSPGFVSGTSNVGTFNWVPFS